MKIALLRWLHLCMAVVVLLSSMGFGLIEHSCQLRGKRVYSVYSHSAPGCARLSCQLHVGPPAAKAQPTLEAANCCENHALFEQVNTGSVLSKWLVKFMRAVADTAGGYVAACFTTLFGPLFSHPTGAAVAGYVPPPLRSGRTLLTFVQTFLI